MRLQTLSQENVRWRQFALESDRVKYRSYWRSNPLRDGDDNVVVTSPKQDVKGDQDGSKTAEPPASAAGEGRAEAERLRGEE